MATRSRIVKPDENEAEKITNRMQTKKVSTLIETKRAVLGDIKENITKPSFPSKNVKARVDTHWKKDALPKKDTRTGETVQTAGLKIPTAVNILKSIANAKAVLAEKRIVTTKVIVLPKKSTVQLPKPAVAVVQPLKAVQNKPLALRSPISRVPNRTEQLKKTEFEDNGVSIKSYSAKLLNTVENIDINDTADPFNLPEYVNDIYDYLFTLENDLPIYPKHLDGQCEVTPKMRAVLMDWINEVHLQFRLNIETFYLSVGIIDRYLQANKTTMRKNLQLVGATALFIAAKYEELLPPVVSEFVYITDDAYNTKQILDMERQIVRTLKFNLGRPLPIHFLRRFSKAAKCEAIHHMFAKYFIELAAIEYTMAHHRPSELAAAAIYLALNIMSKRRSEDDTQVWTSTLQHYSKYSTDDLKPIVEKLALLIHGASSAKLKAVFSKYQNSKFSKIAVRPELNETVLSKFYSS